MVKFNEFRARYCIQRARNIPGGRSVNQVGFGRAVLITPTLEPSSSKLEALQHVRKLDGRNCARAIAESLESFRRESNHQCPLAVIAPPKAQKLVLNPHRLCIRRVAIRICGMACNS